MSIDKLVTELRQLPYIRSVVATPIYQEDGELLEGVTMLVVHKYIREYRRPLKMTLTISNGILSDDFDTFGVVRELLQEAEDRAEPPIYE